jgi:spore maturation protein CgeB
MFETYMDFGPCYDYSFTSGTDALVRYKEAGNGNGYWLPFACDPEIHRKASLTDEELRKYKSDISFVGTCYKERIEVLERLVDFDLGIWGPGWEKLPAQSPLCKCVRGGALQPQEWAKVASASKIGLNILGYQCDIPGLAVDKERCRMANTRLFELFACGILQMVSPRADVLSLFKDGEHFCGYPDDEGLNELVRKYLDDPRERSRIAQNGQKEVLEKHTYRHRIEEMFSIIQGGD